MAVIIGTVLYKLTTLVVGFGLAYLGYRLFLSGVFEGGGDLNASFADNRLVLKKASPGIFFALFGTAVIVVSLWKGQALEILNAAPPNAPILASSEHEIAFEALKEIVSGNQDPSSISSFELSAIESLFARMESQLIATAGTEFTNVQRGRGLASE